MLVAAAMVAAACRSEPAPKPPPREVVIWKDVGAWSIPNGELLDGEEPEATARLEFAEELGVEVTGPLRPLGQIRQSRSKTVVGLRAGR